MKQAKSRVVAASIASVVIAGCIHTQSEVSVKPVDINLNITGRLELVVTDARKQEEKITGSKPKRTVRPEDIGLPPAPEPRSEAGAPDSFRLVLVSTAWAAESDGRQDELTRQMAARHPKIEALRDSHVAGESHTGWLVPRGSLTPSQQELIKAENTDRAELYELESARKKTKVDQVALGYYLARLEHVNKGTWVERYDKSASAWVWFQWDK